MINIFFREKMFVFTRKGGFRINESLDNLKSWMFPLTPFFINTLQSRGFRVFNFQNIYMLLSSQCWQNALWKIWWQKALFSRIILNSVTEQNSRVWNVSKKSAHVRSRLFASVSFSLNARIYKTLVIICTQLNYKETNVKKMIFLRNAPPFRVFVYRRDDDDQRDIPYIILGLFSLVKKV